MQAHGTDLQSFGVQYATCLCKGDSSQSRNCVNLKIVLKTQKTYEYNLFGEEAIPDQDIYSYLNSEFTKIKETANIFKIVKEDHPGYLGFTFAGEFKRLPGEQV